MLTPRREDSALSVICSVSQRMKSSHLSKGTFIHDRAVPVAAVKTFPQVRHRHLCEPFFLLPYLSTASNPHLGQAILLPGVLVTNHIAIAGVEGVSTCL